MIRLYNRLISYFFVPPEKKNKLDDIGKEYIIRMEKCSPEFFDKRKPAASSPATIPPERVEEVVKLLRVHDGCLGAGSR